MKKLLTVALLIAIPCVAVAAGGDLNRLLTDIGGADEAARAAASQLLPRYGLEAIPELIPLLDHKDIVISKTAFHVLWDIANQAAAPGNADISQVIDLLTPLADPSRSATVREYALRLLAITAPEKYDPAPVVAMLKEPDWQEKARTALERMNTEPARAALRTALEESYAAGNIDFTRALLFSLAQLQDAQSADLYRKIAAQGKPLLKTAAALALARTGGIGEADVLQQVMDFAPPEARVEATDAFLKLADAVAAKGGNWDAAMEMYSHVLRKTSSGLFKSAAIMGLARYGDETVVDTIVDAAKAGEPRLQKTIIAAFETLQGKGAAVKMAQAFAGLPPNVQTGLVTAFGRRQDAAYLPVISEAAKSDNAAMRMAGLQALADSELPDGLDLFLDIFKKGSPEEQDTARALVRQVADALKRKANPDGAGKAFVILYKIAKNDTERGLVLERITQSPTAGAYDVVLAAMGNPELAPKALPALVGIAEKLVAAGEPGKAAQAYQLLTSKDLSPELLAQVAGQLAKTDPAAGSAKRLGFVTKWRLAGPFASRDQGDLYKKFVNEPDVDLAAKYTDGDKELAWTAFETKDPMGNVDLYSNVGKIEHCFEYAYAEITVPDAVDVEVRCGADDGERTWVNGVVVMDVQRDRGMKLDEDRAKTHLSKGMNKVLVRVTQNAGGWGFCLRFMRMDGRVLEFDQ